MGKTKKNIKPKTKQAMKKMNSSKEKAKPSNLERVITNLIEFYSKHKKIIDWCLSIVRLCRKIFISEDFSD